MKRQRSRNRGGGGGNNGKPQHNANRAFESNGPDGVKIRGAAQHVFEKYQQLARDALTAGDRVLAESYQQHAEHYFRVLRAVQPQRLVGEIMNRDAFASGYDIDFEDESGGQEEVQAETVDAEAERPADRGEWRQENRQQENRQQENRYERPRDDQRARDDRPRDRNNGGGDRNNNNNGDRNNGYRDDRNGDRQDRSRDDRPRDDRPQENRARDERPREDRYRDDRPRDDRPQENRAREDRPRDDRPRDDRPRDDRPRDDRPRNNDRNDRYRDDRRTERGAERNNDPLPVVEPQATPLVSEVDQPGSPILRSQDGGISQAPAFLQARSTTPAPEADNDAEVRPKPRRKRAPRATDGDSPTPAADVTEDA
jgi:hypothetical protein